MSALSQWRAFYFVCRVVWKGGMVVWRLLRGFYSCRRSREVVKRALHGALSESLRGTGGAVVHLQKNLLCSSFAWVANFRACFVGGLVRRRKTSYTHDPLHTQSNAYYIISKLYICSPCIFHLSYIFFNSMYTCNYMLVSVVDLPFLLPT